MVILIILKLSLLQKEALLNRQKAISPDEMRTARIAIKEVMGNLTSFHQFIEFDINQQELSALCYNSQGKLLPCLFLFT